MPLSPAHSGAAGRLPSQRPLCPPLDSPLEQAGERQQLHLYWEILSRMSRHFQVGWQREQRTAERLARQVWCSGWKAREQVKRTEDVIENTGSWKNNMRVRIRIEGNARGRTLRFVFGPRRRRRLTARVIPLGSLAELSALWRRVFCLVSGLTGEAASWDTQLPTPSTLLSEEGEFLTSARTGIRCGPPHQRLSRL